MHKAGDILRRLVLAQAGDQAGWLEDSLTALATGAPERDLHIFLGFAPRRLGKADLSLTDADRAEIDAASPGCRIDDWSVDGAARVLALLTHTGQRPFAERFKDLRRTSDVAELVALYRGLPMYPEPETMGFEVGEGLRSNIRAVFEAIAHHNPYPRDHFDEHRWNHMILKALFVGSRLAPIVGLDARANPELARVMRDFAHERWAAHRPVSFEIWRIVGPFSSDDAAVADLFRAFDAKDAGASHIDRKAAALGLSVSPSAAVRRRLAAADPVLGAATADGSLNWDSLSAEADAIAAQRPSGAVLPNATPASV